MHERPFRTVQHRELDPVVGPDRESVCIRRGTTAVRTPQVHIDSGNHNKVWNYFSHSLIETTPCGPLDVERELPGLDCGTPVIDQMSHPPRNIASIRLITTVLLCFHIHGSVT